MLTLTLKQTQEEAGGAYFPNSVPVEIQTRAGTRRIKLTPAGRDAVTRINLPARPTEVRFDPEATILKELSVRP